MRSETTCLKMRTTKLGTPPKVSIEETERRRRRCLEYNTSKEGRENSRRNMIKCIVETGLNNLPATEVTKRNMSAAQKRRGDPRQFWKNDIEKIEEKRIRASSEWCKSERGRESSSVTSKERWSKLNKEERLKIVEPGVNKHKENLLSMTKEERSKATEHWWSKRNTKGWWKLMPLEQYERITRNISESVKKIWAERSEEEKERILNGLREGGLKSLNSYKRFFNTNPEMEMKKCLTENDIDFKSHYPIMNIKHRYVADFYISKFNLVIEVDGKWCHNYPNGREIDHVRIQELREAGYKVLRFWEKEFNSQSVLACIKEIINV